MHVLMYELQELQTSWPGNEFSLEEWKRFIYTNNEKEENKKKKRERNESHESYNKAMNFLLNISNNNNQKNNFSLHEKYKEPMN